MATGYGACSFYLRVMQKTADGRKIRLVLTDAEGYRRNNRQEYKQFCGIALGSGGELETQLLACEKVYPNIDVQNVLLLCEEVEKMLYALIHKLK
jgi:four helix bundle protein